MYAAKATYQSDDPTATLPLHGKVAGEGEGARMGRGWGVGWPNDPLLEFMGIPGYRLTIQLE